VNDDDQEKFGIVAIGRNEGDRLKQCLRSLPMSARIVYVDSGSLDGSDAWAKEFGAQVVRLDMDLPFTAARARNTGFKALLELEPRISLVQFIDGDCELANGWITSAIRFLQARVDVGAVFGRRRERYPERSIYNKLCDWEWDGTIGESEAFGGDVMIRTSALLAAQGYNESLIAGEEPELALRLRQIGWRVWRLEAHMTTHDAAILNFSQWWRRNVRSGYAYAEGSYLHGKSNERHWVWQARRAWLWGIWLPIICIVGSIILGRWGMALWLIYPLQLLRQIIRNVGTLRERTIKGIFQVFGRFPEALGQLKFLRNRLLNRSASLIEYK
jgi:glycosyltransferase involved in cell wall biosynthesis